MTRRSGRPVSRSSDMNFDGLSSDREGDAYEDEEIDELHSEFESGSDGGLKKCNGKGKSGKKSVNVRKAVDQSVLYEHRPVSVAFSAV